MSDISNTGLSRKTRSFGGGAGRKSILVLLGVVILLAGAGLAVLGEHLLFGASNAKEVRVVPFDDWRVICPPPGQTANPCTLNMDVLRDTGGTLMSMVLDNPNPGSVLAVTVPHGVALDSGLGFATGNDPLTVRPYETCTSAGCIAFITLDANLLKSMSANMKGNVVVALPGNANPVSVPFSLKGFNDGYAELQRAKSRRDSIFAFLDR